MRPIERSFFVFGLKGRVQSAQDEVLGQRLSTTGDWRQPRDLGSVEAIDHPGRSGHGTRSHD